MKKLVVAVLLLSTLFARAANAADLWKRVVIGASPGTLNIQATAYLVFVADEPALKAALISSAARPVLLSLPMADGSMREFVVRSSAMLPAALAGRYPALKTFDAIATDDPKVTAKLDLTVYGFHAMVFDGDNTCFIDPANGMNTGYYTVHYKRDEAQVFGVSTNCETKRSEPVTNEPQANVAGNSGAKTVNGQQLRTFRFALACSHQYAAAATGLASPTIAEVLSKLVTTMNRVNGVYEREVSVTMKLVDNEDTLIWNTESSGPNGPDPFSTIDGNPTACLSMNQQVCDARIGSSNYDLGHVFTTNAGGFSQIGIICKALMKAQSVTGQPHPTGDGFDIDYLAHEMGHEFGGDHTFNNGKDVSCGGTAINLPTAYEPGSGSTIMAYAGICKPDNIQPHSDDYFHAISLLQIQHYISTAGEVCAIKTPTNNKPVYVPPFTSVYYIPFLTPFELIAPAVTDSVSSASITYCWEQWNLGDPKKRLSETLSYGPIFRSYRPKASRVRVFPRDTLVLAGNLSDAGTNNAQGEKAPEVARTLVFRLTVRNMVGGYGCLVVPDDSIRLEALNTVKGFTVTSQNDSEATYVGGSTQTITWDVVGTDHDPIGAHNVDIYLSEDGGYTWPHQIGTFPNTGSATVPLPNPDTTTTLARIKVKGAGNVFFNVNRYNFTLTHSDGTDPSVRIYPVPVQSTLRISSGDKGLLQFRIYNAAGQAVFGDRVNGLYDVPVDFWARGVYLIRLVDTKGHSTAKKFVIY